MSIWNFCFITSAAAALGGMSLGIVMGATHDFTLAPVHAHLNLLGWVSMMLYGLYYRGALGRAGRLAWAQVAGAALGFPLMTGGLALLLSGIAPANVSEVLVIAGSLLTIGAMACFMAVLVKDAASATSLLGSSPDVDMPAVDHRSS